jgi:quinol monooxygenase YgiN
MIKAVVKLSMTPEKLKEALKILRTITMRSRAETGCLGCAVCTRI